MLHCLARRCSPTRSHRCSQFYQHFTVSLYAIFLIKNYKPNLQLPIREKIKSTFDTKEARVKCWWKWHLWSISSTFYTRIFFTKVLFCQNVTREKHFCTKNSLVKYWWKWHLESLEPSCVLTLAMKASKIPLREVSPIDGLKKGHI